MTVITRLGYCEKCFKEGRPKIGQNFIVFGKTANTFKGLISEKSNRRGCVPHVYKLKFITRKNVVYYKRICCMDNCGASVGIENNKKFIYFNETQWVHEATSLSNWKELVKFRDEAFVI
ncbi:MAG TPA: hypothetical protein VIK86_00550 [Candidatus Paceibacterota bacterium]